MSTEAPTAALTLRPATEFTLLTLSTLMAGAFEGYVVTIPDDPAGFAARVRAEQIDLNASLIVCVDGEPVGLGLIARRGEDARLAGMGVRRGWRGQGVARTLLDRLLDDARARGEARMHLEVIEGNDPAIALYETAGFERRGRLAGYERPAGGTQPAQTNPLIEVPLKAAARTLAQHADDDLPWQLHPATLTALTPPNRALTLGDATAWVLEQPGVLVLRAMLVPPAARRQGQGRALLEALTRAFPDHRMIVPAIVQERQVDGFLTACDFRQTTLSQLEMTCPLK
ncbi:GNAT family N-acetyltransferase [Deinococcus sedimenti]|uniref:N-acetyltransferase GCN5 n=1 Tax=Deinococcus sedimenti TaxID=1867090 RepID=A0ABQ2S2E6_9DEIO|nr:GNAT family N-acetyltransferase [Deinococcus sedimenti]GGR91324.1 N-acetyltransferase GCN5 [Deinococcus sedimenti]